MSIFSIITSQERPEAFDCILKDPSFAGMEEHPQTGAYARSYYPAVYGEDHRDLSFAVCAGGKPALVCLCTLIKGVIGLYGLPMRLFAGEGLSGKPYRAAVRSAFSHLDQLAQTCRAREVVVGEKAAPVLSPIGEAGLARAARASPHLLAQVDLTAEPAEWRAALRKSFRSLINWGRRNFAIDFANCDQPNRHLFDRFRQFHAEVAGRVTRPKASWDVMFDWIAKGGGELVAASLEGRLVAASLFIDGTDVCIYMTGVYDRSLFDKPLAHYPVWLGIERAQKRGMKFLELGDVQFKGAVSEKEYQLRLFTRGFATQIDTHLIWRWSPDVTSTSGLGNGDGGNSSF